MVAFLSRPLPRCPPYDSRLAPPHCSLPSPRPNRTMTSRGTRPSTHLDRPMGRKNAIEAYIQENSERPGAADARLVESGVPVWAIIGSLRLAEGSPEQQAEQVAEEYGIPLAAVLAATYYYQRHRL